MDLNIKPLGKKKKQSVNLGIGKKFLDLTIKVGFRKETTYILDVVNIFFKLLSNDFFKKMKIKASQ